MNYENIRKRDLETIQKANEWFKLQIGICDDQIEYLKEQKKRLRKLIQEEKRYEK